MNKYIVKNRCSLALSSLKRANQTLGLMADRPAYVQGYFQVLLSHLREDLEKIQAEVNKEDSVKVTITPDQLKDSFVP